MNHLHRLLLGLTLMLACVCIGHDASASNPSGFLYGFEGANEAVPWADGFTDGDNIQFQLFSTYGQLNNTEVWTSVGAPKNTTAFTYSVPGFAYTVWAPGCTTDGFKTTYLYFEFRDVTTNSGWMQSSPVAITGC
jgi:hypothetical protein